MMTQQMSFRDMVAVQPTKDMTAPKPKPRRMPKQYVNTLEFDLINSLVKQQYLKDGVIRFDLLNAIDQQERIPALMTDFGTKRMYQMLLMMVKAFCFGLRIPKIKKLSDTKMSGVACDLMVAAQEDGLALEDVILFFDKASSGGYGSIKSLAYHYQMMSLFEQYRKERKTAFEKMSKPAEDIPLKVVTPTERIAPEPTPIGDLLQSATVINMTRRMSG